MSVAGTDSAISLVEILYLEEKKRLPAGVFARVTSALASPISALAAIAIDASIAATMALINRDSIPPTCPTASSRRPPSTWASP